MSGWLSMPVTVVLVKVDRWVSGAPWTTILAKKVSFWFCERPYLKSISQAGLEEDTTNFLLWLP